MTTLKNWLINSRKSRLAYPNTKLGDEERQSLVLGDPILFFVVIAMVLFGLIMVYSSSFIFAQEKTGDGFSLIKKQLGFAGIGVLAFFVALRIQYRQWEKWAYPALLVAASLIAMTFIPGLGLKVGGAQRWLHWKSWHFQPGELAKFAVICFAARQLDLKKDRIHSWSAGIFSQFVAPLPILGLLLLQPDFGTTVMIVLVIFSMMFVAGVPLRIFLTTVILGAAAGGWLALGSAYRRSRLIAFLDPWSDPGGKGFQILQSFIGLHQGSVWGVGLGNGKQKLFFLPEAHNDFILSVIGEELGFMGIVGVVLAYLFLVLRGLQIAWRAQTNHKDRFGMLLATGITLALGLQGFINIAVVLGLVPTKGLTLPFLSYGGSALVVDLFALGVLLNIAQGKNSILGKKWKQEGVS